MLLVKKFVLDKLLNRVRCLQKWVCIDYYQSVINKLLKSYKSLCSSNCKP